MNGSSLSAPVESKGVDLSVMEELLIVDSYLNCFGNSRVKDSLVRNGLKERFYYYWSVVGRECIPIFLISSIVLCVVMYYLFTNITIEEPFKVLIGLGSMIIYLIILWIGGHYRAMYANGFNKAKRSNFFKQFDINWGGDYRDNSREIYFMLKSLSTFFKKNGTYGGQKEEIELQLKAYSLLDIRGATYNKEVEMILSSVYNRLISLTNTLYKFDENVMLNVWKERKGVHLKNLDEGYKEHLLNKLEAIKGKQ